MLLVVSIILIIGSVISTIDYLSGLAFLEYASNPGLILFVIVFGLITNGFFLYAGVVGIKSYKKLKNVSKCITIGKIMIGLHAVRVVLSIIAEIFSIFYIVDFIFPVLYLFVAHKLKYDK